MVAVVDGVRWVCFRLGMNGRFDYGINDILMFFDVCCN